MTALLELRQKISEVYGRYEAYVRICTKCLLAFLVFYMIHSQLSGSMNPRSWAEIVVATLIAVMIPIVRLLNFGSNICNSPYAYDFSGSRCDCCSILFIFVIDIFYI